MKKAPSFIRKLSFIVVSLALLLSCEKNDNTCNCKDPLKDLAWLQEVKTSLTNCFCEMSIIQATFNKQTVFYTAMTDPLCDGLYSIVLRDCKGDTVKSFESVHLAANEISDIRVLHRCKD